METVGSQHIFLFVCNTVIAFRNLYFVYSGLKPKVQVQYEVTDPIFSSDMLFCLSAVPPSPPVCTVTGNPVVKGNVTLSCKSSQGKPLPQYKWTKAAPMSEVFFSPMQSEYLNQDVTRLPKWSVHPNDKKNKNLSHLLYFR